MKEKLKGIFVGLLVGVMATGTVAYAAGTSKIEVVFENIKYMVDGIEKKSQDQGIVYKGQLYAPVKFIAQSGGKDFNYDGKAKTVWIGKKEGSFKYLSDLEYARADGIAKGDTYLDKIRIAGNEYNHGMGIKLNKAYGKEGSIDYNLNGKYKKLSGFIGINDATKNSDSIGCFKVLGDGNELYKNESLKGGDVPTKIDVDVTGVLKLQIVFEYKEVSNNYMDYDLYIDFADAKLFQ